MRNNKSDEAQLCSGNKKQGFINHLRMERKTMPENVVAGLEHRIENDKRAETKQPPDKERHGETG